MKLERTQLTTKEKDLYWKSLLEDLDSNRRPYDPSRSWFSRTFDFHWHTNIQNVSKISTVRFSKRIKVNGHSIITKKLPTALCLVFNKDKHAYDRCTESQEGQALTMREAARHAANDPACANTPDPFDCGESRDRQMPSLPRTMMSVVDDRLLKEI